MAEVLVAGGGIAGSALAIMLGRAGRQVELFERSHFPREKACGEGLFPGGVAVLGRLGLSEAIGGAPFQGVRFHQGSLVVEGRFARDGVHGLGQRRALLDQALFAAAASTPGVVAHTGAPVEAPIREHGRVCGLLVAGAQRRAPLTVVADGLRSPLRRQLGLEGAAPRRVRVGVRTHYQLAPGQRQPGWVEVFLGGGYELYVTPLPAGQVLVACLAERELLGSQVERRFRQWVEAQPILRARLEGAERLSDFRGAAPLASRPRARVLPGAVLLGDAAGFLDPITGGGMTQALLSAELLAACLPAALDDDAWLPRFDRRRQTLLRDYRLLTGFVLWLSARPAPSRWMLRLLRLSPWLFSHLIGVSGGTRRLLGGAVNGFGS